MFGIELDTTGFNAGQNAPNYYPLTYNGIQKWIEDNFGVKICKSSITMVRDKCNASNIAVKAGEEPKPGIVKTEKEKLVLEAFRHFNVI